MENKEAISSYVLAVKANTQGENDAIYLCVCLTLSMVSVGDAML